MGTGDPIFIAILLILVAGFWTRRRWRFVDDQRGDARSYRKWSKQIGGNGGGGDGGAD